MKDAVDTSQAADLEASTEQSRDPLEEIEQRFRSLMEGIDVGVVIHAPDTTILFVNPRAAELLGATADMLRGKTSFDPRWRALRDDGSEFPAHERPTAMAFKTRSPQRGIVVGIYRPETDDRVWLLISAIPQLNADGSIRQVVATFTDISTQKEQQDEIQKQSELILDLSVPFIPLTEGIALMPVVGVLDAKRARRILEVALAGSAHEGVSALVLDMTGVPRILPEAAEEIVRIANACKLIGTNVMISGLCGDAARVLVNVDSMIHHVPMVPRLKTALTKLLTPLQNGRRSKSLRHVDAAENTPKAPPHIRSNTSTRER